MDETKTATKQEPRVTFANLESIRRFADISNATGNHDADARSAKFLWDASHAYLATEEGQKAGRALLEATSFQKAIDTRRNVLSS